MSPAGPRSPSIRPGAARPKAERRSGDPEATYYQAIEEFFVARRGDPLFLSNADWVLIRKWRAAGIPLRVVLRGIADALDGHAHSWSRKAKVGSLRYCAAEVDAACERWRRALQLGREAGEDLATVLRGLAATIERARGGPRTRAVADRVVAGLRQRAESPGAAVVVLWLSLASGLLFGAALRRMSGPAEDLYAGIARLLQTRGGDSMARMAQIEELRARQARFERAAAFAAWLVPGAAGMAARRPLLGGVGCALFASGASLWWHRHGAVADPLALGVLPSALVAVGLAGLSVAYLLALGLAFALRERG